MDNTPLPDNVIKILKEEEIKEQLNPLIKSSKQLNSMIIKSMKEII